MLKMNYVLNVIEDESNSLYQWHCVSQMTKHVIKLVFSQYWQKK